MELAEGLDFIGQRHRGILTTIKADGRPQLSNIMYHLDGDVVRVSVTADRAKTHNLRRDPRVSLYVGRDDFWAYVVLEGTAEFSAVATEPGDAVTQELADLFRAVGGEHPDWGEFHRTMVDDHRLVLRLMPQRAYGMLSR